MDLDMHPSPHRRWWRFAWLRLFLVSFGFVVVVGIGIYRYCFSPIAKLQRAMASADRVVIRDGGFDCCGPVDQDVVICEVNDPSEIEELRSHLEFDGVEEPCHCGGFPGVDWYRGQERVALTAMQHGKAFRWRGCSDDFRLSQTSQDWLGRWLVKHGVNEQDLPKGLGGPRAPANRLLAIGRYDRAISGYSHALERNPSDSLAYYGRGLAYAKKGDKLKAERDFAMARKLGHKIRQTSEE